MNLLKKITIITAIFMLSLTSLYATGAGFQLSADPGIVINSDRVNPEKFSAAVTGTVKLSRIPVAAGFGLEAGKAFSDFAYGIYGFADYWIFDLQLKNTWNFYSGCGASGNLLTSDFKNWSAEAGARIFAGMNWLFWDNYLEVYIQQNVVPTYNFNLNKAASKGHFMLCLPFEAGLRLHF